MSDHRATIFPETATVLERGDWPGDQHVLRLHAPETAAHARPGQFVHLACDPLLPMRRPLSIQLTDPEAGWIELLFKVVGYGTRLLARREAGDELALLGPIGRPFEVPPEVRFPVLVGGGVGIPPMVFLARELAGRAEGGPVAFLGSEVPFPFTTTEAGLDVPGAPQAATAADARLEAWGVPNRLASTAGLPGAHTGYVTDLAESYLNGLAPEQRAQAAIFAVGPEPMLAATARVGRTLAIPVWVSLEEHMACAVGGCAGCTVRVEEPAGPAMRRVCVDGPVFPAEQVFPD